MVKKTYKVLEEALLTINKGEFVGVIEPSGSGKTTLFKQK